MNYFDKLWLKMFIKSFAERKGFEPLIRLWRIHTFQACAFDHSATSPSKKLPVYGACFKLLKYKKNETLIPLL
jgi:hypothetical protein